MQVTIITRRGLFVLFVFFCAGHAALSQRQNLLLESTFENGSYLAGWNNSQHCCAYSVQQTTEQIKGGSNALRMEVRSTDPGVSGSIRSEIALNTDPLNEDRWYGFSLYLKDWADDAAPESVFQWHPDNTSGSAAMSLHVAGGSFSFTTNNTGGTSDNEYIDLGPVISNKWIDFVIRIRWSTDSTGLLQLWMNRNLMIDRSGVKNAAIESYFKLGINKFGWGHQSSAISQRIAYYDEVRIGNANASYKDVAPFLPKRDYFGGL
ncbi:MAG: polysaccharide lyase [Chitinophagaceae bacterium]|nr:polysaccharide lyase [Chitinophagaceae bacterium]